MLLKTEECNAELSVSYQLSRSFGSQVVSDQWTGNGWDGLEKRERERERERERAMLVELSVG